MGAHLCAVTVASLAEAVALLTVALVFKLRLPTNVFGWSNHCGLIACLKVFRWSGTG
jgi:hypothetical protein